MIWGRLNAYCVGSYYSNWIQFFYVFLHVNSLTAKSVLAGEKLVAMYSIST
jgi:hypothetical protein